MQGSYSLSLVILSYVVAVLASHVTLGLAQRLRVRESGGPHFTRQWPWVVGGAFSMGTGIWSMHFIGMLAFHLPIAVAYDLSLTAASYAIAVVVSGFALLIFRRNDTTVSGIALPGVFMGLGITAMHYTGMVAMKMEPGIRYAPGLFGASVLIAIGASIAALTIAFSLPQGRAQRNWHTLVAASVMGAAIVGMHFTGMAAALFAPNAFCITSGPTRLDLARGDHRRFHLPDPRIHAAPVRHRCAAPVDHRTRGGPTARRERRARAACRGSHAASDARARAQPGDPGRSARRQGSGRGGQSRQGRIPRNDQP
jgi:NO-binding membrane sensor protein with MHYT domain